MKALPPLDISKLAVCAAEVAATGITSKKAEDFEDPRAYRVCISLMGFWAGQPYRNAAKALLAPYRAKCAWEGE